MQWCRYRAGILKAVLAPQGEVLLFSQKYPKKISLRFAASRPPVFLVISDRSRNSRGDEPASLKHARLRLTGRKPLRFTMVFSFFIVRRWHEQTPFLHRRCIAAEGGLARRVARGAAPRI